MTEIRKIFITGGAGAGKTTLGRQLADHLGFRFVELDAVMWNLDGGGDAVSAEERQRGVEEIAGQSGWVVEGSYVGTVQQIWNKSDLILFVEVSNFVSLWRIFLRHVRAEISGNNRHKGWWKLLKFMKVVFKANRDSYVGDLESDNDEPKLTLARLVAKRSQYPDKTIVVRDPANIDEILATIHSKQPGMRSTMRSYDR